MSGRTRDHECDLDEAVRVHRVRLVVVVVPGVGQRAVGEVEDVLAGVHREVVFVVSNSLKTGNNIFTSGVFSLFTQFDYENYVRAWSGISAPLLNTIIVAAL